MTSIAAPNELRLQYGRPPLPPVPQHSPVAAGQTLPGPPPCASEPPATRHEIRDARETPTRNRANVR